MPVVAKAHRVERQPIVAGVLPCLLPCHPPHFYSALHTLGVIEQQDGERTLFYIDPPYVPTTRVAQIVYRHEMDNSAHEDLLATVRQCHGLVMISGYPNELYDRMLYDWNRCDREIDNKVSGARTKRTMTESLWFNF